MKRIESPFLASLDLLTQNRCAPLLAILAISVPSNLGAEYVIYTFYSPDDFVASMRVTGFVSTLVLPLHATIIIRAASLSSSGLLPSHKSLLQAAFGRWAHVFKARFLATAAVAIGTFPFVLPGLLLAIRYAFVEVLAVEEGSSGAESRKRSAELASGRGIQIFRLLACVAGSAIVAIIVVFAPLGFWPEYDTYATAAFGDVLFDLIVSALYGGAWYIYSRVEPDPTPPVPRPIA